MTARYLLCPGKVRSRTDGQWHHISASQLAMLYRVPMDACLVMPSDWFGPWGERRREELRERVRRGDLIELGPRFDGDYTPPAVPALPPANPYACHNRAPFKTTVAMPDGHSFPFRMAMDCQYTLSALGQVDPRCTGCKWRRAP